MAIFVSNAAMKQVSYGFTWDEIQKMLDIAKKDERTYLLMLILSYTGRRISEVVGEFKRAIVKIYWIGSDGKKDKTQTQLIPLAVPALTPEKIDFQNGVITWCIEKKVKKKSTPNEWQKASRVFATIETHPKVMDALKAYIEKNNIGKLDSIFKFQRQYAYKLIRKVFDEAEIRGKKRILHAFRHGFAIQLLKSGSTPDDLVRLQNLLMHDNIQTTMSYTVYSDSDRRKLLERLK